MPRRTRTPVLILARDPVLAALIGIALELGDVEPLFAAPGERLEDAIARHQPRVVVLLDGELDEADSDLFFARVTRRGARLVLFAVPGAAAESAARVAAIAATRGVPFLDMPTSEDALRAVLAATADSDSVAEPAAD